VTDPTDVAATADPTDGPTTAATGGPTGPWDGADYQRRLEATAAAGGDDHDPHGEVALVLRHRPRAVLDAGCGTGRVAIELHRRGVEVVGVDVSASMLATARELAPELAWVEQDLTALDLDRRFDVVVLAGNVPLFTPPGTTGALVAGCARHLAADGVLIAGFQLGRGYDLATWDADTAAAGLALQERYATWERDPFTATSDYAVSVHGPRPVAASPDV
jgi:SAM-dependent methyltransferase